MRKETIIKLLLIAVPVAFFAGIKCKNSLDRFDNIGKPTIEVVAFYNYDLNDSIYLVAKHWGLTGDHSVVALTKRYDQGSEWYPDSTKDLIWKQGFVFFKKDSNKIKIWTEEVPGNNKRLNTKQKIEFIQIDNVFAMKLREELNSSIKLIE